MGLSKRMQSESPPAVRGGTPTNTSSHHPPFPVYKLPESKVRAQSPAHPSQLPESSKSKPLSVMSKKLPSRSPASRAFDLYQNPQLSPWLSVVLEWILQPQTTTTMNRTAAAAAVQLLSWEIRCKSLLRLHEQTVVTTTTTFSSEAQNNMVLEALLKNVRFLPFLCFVLFCWTKPLNGFCITAPHWL
jgi:hypothetical protein